MSAAKEKVAMNFKPTAGLIGMLLGGVSILSGCSPSVQTNLIHPDADKSIVFNTSKGSVKGNVSLLELEVGGSIVASTSASSLEYTGGPYPIFSNMMLPYKVYAHSNYGVKTNTGSLYIANAKGHYRYTVASGSNNGYPNSTAEQTGPNLYRLDKAVVRTHAQNAVIEYANARGLTTTQVLATADHMVEAVARYVSQHMSWRSDELNRQVFADNGYESYSPGWDFPQPADLTLTISGALNNVSSSDDFMGDGEDHAILRAALLHALGFAPWAIWNVIDSPVSHEYNVVLYQGAFRLMDYGTIDRWLKTHTWDAHQSYFGWNAEHGPRGTADLNHDYLKDNTHNYPGGRSNGNTWSYQGYYQDVAP
ncbi:hypothetical protein [Thalassolituus sp.]|uniref:hypothetical protein n=1 Tax=Thalassolituus sp. TaxID=2030822 RepID=UPI002A80A9CD|nr:hypothetical protein [Thalassolituus sp.]